MAMMAMMAMLAACCRCHVQRCMGCASASLPGFWHPAIRKPPRSCYLPSLVRRLVGSHDEQGELPPRTDQTTEESDAKRLMREAADYFGMPTSVPEAVGSVQAWLSNPSHAEESADSQMVARLLHRLLQSYEQHTGEDFEGEQHQFDQLYELAKAALGSSLTKRTLKSLVRSYLGI